ncbi:zinc ribbon domain-containing protein [Halorussus salinus]|nr:zinc ribbon domain-containing protein [Halorussus salinus]
MGDPACYLDFCPECDAQVTIADEECPDCGTEIEET